MYDVIIIGNGPAGVSASLYTQRANMRTLIIGKDNGALIKAEKIENYYGFPEGISGNKLLNLGIDHALNLGVELKREEVLVIDYIDEEFSVITNNNKYKSKSVIIATGMAKKMSNIDGIKDFEGKGVSYCAICDGFFFKNKNVAVIGNGDYALHEVNELLPIVNEVSILTNGKQSLNLRSDKIKVLDKPIKKLIGKDRLEKIEFEDNTEIDISAVFVAEGTASSVDFARRIGANTNGNNIMVDENYMTNIPGLFAAGDCIGGLLQISKAVGDGAKAGISTIKYIREHK